ncbi:MAG: hypothetical protein U0X76_03550 [Bacteroidia bacterium]
MNTKSYSREAYSGSEDTQITNRSILQAIAEYERTLIGMNSRFDRTMSGREFVMNQDEINGFNLFAGKANCASCHFLPLFNSLLPPEYVETEWEVVAPSAKMVQPRELDPDLGRYNIIPVDIFKHAFKEHRHCAMWPSPDSLYAQWSFQDIGRSRGVLRSGRWKGIGI